MSIDNRFTSMNNDAKNNTISAVNRIKLVYTVIVHLKTIWKTKIPWEDIQERVDNKIDDDTPRLLTVDDLCPYVHPTTLTKTETFTVPISGGNDDDAPEFKSNINVDMNSRGPTITILPPQQSSNQSHFQQPPPIIIISHQKEKEEEQQPPPALTIDTTSAEPIHIVELGHVAISEPTTLTTSVSLLSLSSVAFSESVPATTATPPPVLVELKQQEVVVAAAAVAVALPPPAVAPPPTMATVVVAPPPTMPPNLPNQLNPPKPEDLATTTTPIIATNIDTPLLPCELENKSPLKANSADPSLEYKQKRREAKKLRLALQKQKSAVADDLDLYPVVAVKNENENENTNDQKKKKTKKKKNTAKKDVPQNPVSADVPQNPVPLEVPQNPVSLEVPQQADVSIVQELPKVDETRPEELSKNQKHMADIVTDVTDLLSVGDALDFLLNSSAGSAASSATVLVSPRPIVEAVQSALNEGNQSVQSGQNRKSKRRQANNKSKQKENPEPNLMPPQVQLIVHPAEPSSGRLGQVPNSTGPSHGGLGQSVQGPDRLRSASHVLDQVPLISLSSKKKRTKKKKSKAKPTTESTADPQQPKPSFLDFVRKFYANGCHEYATFLKILTMPDVPKPQSEDEPTSIFRFSMPYHALTFKHMSAVLHNSEMKIPKVENMISSAVSPSAEFEIFLTQLMANYVCYSSNGNRNLLSIPFLKSVEIPSTNNIHIPSWTQYKFQRSVNTPHISAAAQQKNDYNDDEDDDHSYYTKRIGRLLLSSPSSSLLESTTSVQQMMKPYFINSLIQNSDGCHNPDHTDCIPCQYCYNHSWCRQCVMEESYVHKIISSATTKNFQQDNVVDNRSTIHPSCALLRNTLSMYIRRHITGGPNGCLHCGIRYKINTALDTWDQISLKINGIWTRSEENLRLEHKIIAASSRNVRDVVLVWNDALLNKNKLVRDQILKWNKNVNYVTDIILQYAVTIVCTQFDASESLGTTNDMLVCTSSLLFKCSSCKLAFYCDKECQTKDWALHKKECTDTPKKATPIRFAKKEPPVLFAKKESSRTL